MAEQLILLDPTEEVFGKCLKEIANGTITVAAAADFPIGEKYPAGTVDKLIADFLEHHEVEGLSHTLPYPRVPVDKNHKPRPVDTQAAKDVLRRVLEKR